MCLFDEVAEGQGLKGCGEWDHRTLRLNSRASPVLNEFVTDLHAGVEYTIRKFDTNNYQSGRCCLGEDALQRSLCG